MSAVPMRNASAAMENDNADALSAFMDGEADMPSFLTDSIKGRKDWDTYHLIGDILRSEALAQPVSQRFSQGLSQALQAEPTIIAPKPRGLHRFVGRYALPGVALTVVVIAVTWVAQPYIAPSGPLQASLAPAPSTLMSAAALPNPGLADYIDAHRHVTGMGGVNQAGLDAEQP